MLRLSHTRMAVELWNSKTIDPLPAQPACLHLRLQLIHRKLNVENVGQSARGDEWEYSRSLVMEKNIDNRDSAVVDAHRLLVVVNDTKTVDAAINASLLTEPPPAISGNHYPILDHAP